MASLTVNQPTALPLTFATTLGGTVTLVAGTANTDRVWMGTAVATCIWPWYGSAGSAGGTITMTGITAGAPVYVYSPAEPASYTLTIV